MQRVRFRRFVSLYSLVQILYKWLQYVNICRYTKDYLSYHKKITVGLNMTNPGVGDSCLIPHRSLLLKDIIKIKTNTRWVDVHTLKHFAINSLDTVYCSFFIYRTFNLFLACLASGQILVVWKCRFCKSGTDTYHGANDVTHNHGNVHSFIFMIEQYITNMEIHGESMWHHYDKQWGIELYIIVEEWKQYITWDISTV